MAIKRILYQKCSLVWCESKILPNPVFCSYKRKRKKQLWSGLRQKLMRTYLLSDDRYRKCQLKCTCFGNMIRMMSQIWQSPRWTTVQSKDVRKINKKRKIPSSSIQPFLCTETCILGGIWIRSWRTPLKMTFGGSFSPLALSARTTVKLCLSPPHDKIGTLRLPVNSRVLWLAVQTAWEFRPCLRCGLTRSYDVSGPSAQTDGTRRPVTDITVNEYVAVSFCFFFLHCHQCLTTDLFICYKINW